MKIDPAHLEDTRTMQAMFFSTKAGELLLQGICQLGHIKGTLTSEKERFEYNFARNLLEGAGIELVAKPAVLEEGNINEDV